MNQDHVRLIKKYTNRRLYDTKTSCYITLEELRQLIIERIPIKIIAAKTNEDITRSCMIQIILEQEEVGNNSAIFTTETLANIIRFYNDPLQAKFSKFINQSFNLFFNNI